MAKAPIPPLPWEQNGWAANYQTPPAAPAPSEPASAASTDQGVDSQKQFYNDLGKFINSQVDNQLLSRAQELENARNKHTDEIRALEKKIAEEIPEVAQDPTILQKIWQNSEGQVSNLSPATRWDRIKPLVQDGYQMAKQAVNPYAGAIGNGAPGGGYASLQRQQQGQQSTGNPIADMYVDLTRREAASEARFQEKNKSYQDLKQNFLNSSSFIY